MAWCNFLALAFGKLHILHLIYLFFYKNIFRISKGRKNLFLLLKQVSFFKLAVQQPCMVVGFCK